MSEPTPPQNDLIGKTIGPYQIEEEIGQSRWGKVYRAFQSSIHRTVALKVLSPEIAALPGEVDHFRGEARATAQIIHSQIVAIYEAGYADGVHFCAMEFMDGPPLAQFLRKDNAVDEHHLLQAVIGVAHAVDFLWSRKIPHQPPSEVNILTANSGTVKLAKVEPIGAPPSSKPQDDIMALGLVLAGLANEIGAVSRPLGELVERMLDAESRKPFDSLVELADAAQKLDQELFSAPPPPKPTIERTQPKSIKLIVIVVGAAAIILAIVLTAVHHFRMAN